MTSDWSPEILEDVVRDLREKKLYLFAGAGLSNIAGYPLLKDLLRELANVYKNHPYRKPEIASVADDLVEDRSSNSLDIIQHLIDLGESGSNAFVRVLQKNFEEERTSEVHRMLVKLPFAGYVTINFDRCLEKASGGIDGAEQLAADRWFCFPKHKFAPKKSLDGIYDGTRFLLHMHGCLYYEGRIDSQDIILRREQYSKFYKSTVFNRIFREMFHRPFLILGTSLSDTFFMNRLFEARGSHDCDVRAERKNCYVVLPKCERRNTHVSDEEIYGIRFNYFDKNDKNAIEKMVKELKDVCEQTVRVPPE